MTRRAPIIGVLVAVLLAVAFYFLLWSPKQTELEEVRAETAQLETRRASLQNELRQLREIEANEAEFRAALARLEEYIPSGPAQATVVRQLQLAADASGVVITSLTFGQPVPVEEAPPTGEEGTVLAAITVSGVVEGGYFQAVDFFRRLEVDVVRAFLPQNFSMDEGEEEFPSLATTWSSAMFAVVPAPEPAVAPPPPPPADGEAEGGEEAEGADAEGETEPAEEETP